MSRFTPKTLAGSSLRVIAAGLALALVGQPVLGQAPADKPTYPARPTAPAGAPNILVIMTDDTGFSASSAFGGSVPTPNIDALAKKGLRYNRFHTSAMCSPTRAALLTGRNSHSVGFGVISEEASPDPGYNSIIPNSAATFAKVLGMNGYDTAMFGKHHNVPVWEETPLGPYDHWPTGLGFNYYYGFMGGATNQFAPALIENVNWKEIDQATPDYILDKDLADHAIDWLHMQHSINAKAPFAMYYAPGSTHSPHQAPAEWIARFKGKFDQGWDKLREENFARQKREGIIPANTVLTPRPKEFPAWSSLSADQRRVQARMMEVAAAQLAYLDHEIGRIVTALKENGQFDNTMIVLIIGDNGASLEGSPEGTVDEIARNKNKMPESLQDQIKAMDAFGTRYSWNNYPAPWAWANNTPFQWGKAIGSHLGGVRNGMIISWPGHLQGEGGIRTQFSHVIDIAPTLYEAVGITPPSEIDGVKQMPIAGESLLYTFKDARAPDRRTQQYFELRENIGFYKDGWFASTEPRVFPWQKEAPPRPDEQVTWRLYNLNEDFSQSKDLSAKNPQKLAELRAAYEAVAGSYNVKPAASLTSAPRPMILGNQTQFVFHNSDLRYPRPAFPNLMNRSWSIDADIVVPESGGDGALVAQGSRIGGWGFLVLNGKPTFLYNGSIADRDRTTIAAQEPLSPGPHRVKASFAYDGGGTGKGGVLTLEVDGKPVGTGRIPRTFGALIVGEGGATIGRDYGTTLSDAYQAPFIYPGTINSVTFGLQPVGK